MKQKKVKILQYPRGVNKGGGVISVNYCPTISTSSFQNNCFLIVYEKKDNSEIRESGRKTQEVFRQ